MSISPQKVSELEARAKAIRIDIVKMLEKAGSGHTAGSLGMADVFTTLYFYSLNHKPENPQWPDRDRLILSNGHICPVLYAAMAHSGYFDISVLYTLRSFNSPLQGHPHREFLPALETSSGPLGSGLSQAVGMALADRIDNGRESNKAFFCLMGDGETNEGQIWEAAMLASKHSLGNLICIVDRNNIQIDGHTQDIMPLEPYREKWESFGFHVLDINGHNIEEIADAIDQGRAVFQKPTLIIAHTIASKGVSEWERKYKWHGEAPNAQEAQMAIAELEK
ncbi:MAG: transketolase [Patescibacteria group bacterium]